MGSFEFLVGLDWIGLDGVVCSDGVRESEGIEVLSFTNLNPKPLLAPCDPCFCRVNKDKINSCGA